MKTFRKKSVFGTWFLSYILMMGMVLVFSIVLYFYSYEIIKKQALQVNYTLLENMQGELDGCWREARSMLNSLLLDDRVQKAIKVNGEFSISDHELLYELHNDLIKRCAASRTVKHTFIYFANGQTVISNEGHMNMELFYDLYYQNKNHSAEDFSAYLNEHWTGNLQIRTNSRGTDEILFLQNAFPRGIIDPAATFVVSFPEEDVQKWLDAMTWDSSVQLFILDDSGKFIGEDNVLQMLTKEQQNAMNLGEYFGNESTLKIGSTSYMVLNIPSAETGLHYVALMPNENIREDAKRIQIFMMFGLAACIALGIVAAYILTGIHYNPLVRIMNMFGNYNKDITQRRQNEYQWLTDHTVRFLEEHKEIKKKLYNNEQVLKNQYLYRLITLPYDENDEHISKIQQFSLFQFPYFLVILLYVENNEASSWQDEYESGLFRFIFNNVLLELLGTDKTMEIVQLADSFACIVNSKQDGTALKDELEYVFDQNQKFASERMKISVTAVCGSVGCGLDSIYTSYLMARETSAFLNHSQEQTIIWYHDIQNCMTIYDFPMDQEQKIINAIRIGDAAHAVQWIHFILVENFKKEIVSPSQRKLLFYELLATVRKGAEQGSCIEYMNQLDVGNDVYGHTETASEYFRKLVTDLCDGILKKEQERRLNTQFGKQVMEYVQQNYQDPDLNISITALHFNITPSYLSFLFKEQTGIGLLEYINNTRIEHVKRLLEEGKNINEICNESGFRNSGALIRVFKKSTGITPGQMKKLLE